MLAVGPAMDSEFPQHEVPPAGSVLYSPPPLQGPLQNAMLQYPWWTAFASAPCPAFSSGSQCQFGSPASFQPRVDTSYGPVAATPSFLPKSDFSQEPSYVDDLSNASIFSSSLDSLSDIVDTSDFLPADRLSQVPTIWDVSTGPPAHNKLVLSSDPFSGLEDPASSLPSTPLLISYQSQSQPEEEDEAEEDESEELGHTEVYADYVPSKSKIGKQHPDRVVETSTLSSVPPPDITYTLALPVSDSGVLSALQLEAITYACQQHEVLLPGGQRAGFLIGDGAGVGKGRTVAGIILENYLRGRKKSLWFSVSNDLKYDAERDLRDIDASSIAVHALNKIKYGDNTTSEGVLFATYSALIGESQAGGQHRTRIRQILEWCGSAFDGVIVFDECHKAKNASCTKMGRAVLDLQNKLPLARVVYASATGASEPRNMIYMNRLGIWGEGTPFRTFEEFLHAVEKRGVGAMEIVAMDMKVSGMYIARQLSFSGVTFRVEEIPLDPAFERVYNRAALLWAEALGVFQQAADWIGLESRKSLWGQFWSAHQRFFKYLCIAAKVRRLVELAQEELARDKCVVIGLQSTGEARTREVLDEKDGQLDCFVSAAEGVFLSLIQKHFPSTKRKRDRGTGMGRLDLCPEISLTHSHQGGTGGKGTSGGPGPGTRAKALPPADMKQGLLSVGIGGRESRSGCLDVEKDCSITKFLNRILGLEVHKQNALFQYFSDTFDHLIEVDKREGKYDMGILDLAPGIDEIYEESQQVFLAPGHPQDGQIVFYKISVDRGLKWEEAYTRSLELTGPHDGFYLSYKVRGNQPSCLLAEQNHGKFFTVYKPNIGRQSQQETFDSLCRKFHRVTAEEAREPWESSYTLSLRHCSHTAWNRQCRLVQEGKDCVQGLRLRHHYMLCGALLRVWGRIAAVMAEVTSSSYLQIVRLKTKDKKKQVGIKIPETCVPRVLQELQVMDANVKRKNAHAQGFPAPPPALRPLALACGPGEVLDLTYSPPAQAFATPSPFAFPLPPDPTPAPSSLLLGAPDAPADPAALVHHQGCDINFKEVLEDMLRSLNAVPPPEQLVVGAGAPGAPGGGGGAERQSVIQFSPHFPNS
ncbi:protein strawberry notch homolog 2 [Pteropus medius]|uniref:protein strawberry notch homolog 2 n=1 Tax=Pteropus vampyrus TaxID=132908 RepID=UPI00196A7317|nr:protein strawberry notch homolog 2 [Pteropus giganteus]